MGKGTASKLNEAVVSILKERNIELEIFNVSESGVPLFDLSLFQNPPEAVLQMAVAFKRADVHIWLMPMYHGSLPGVMKNCLDWLEVTSGDEIPYLTDKLIGMICWADGGQAMLGIDAMENVAKSLRAWTLPYSIPIVRGELYQASNGNISAEYNRKLNKLVDMLLKYKRLMSTAVKINIEVNK